MTPSPLTAKGLSAVGTFIVPSDVLEDTIGFLRDVGANGHEGFVLWGGELETADVFRFRAALFPEQYAMRTDHGLLVVVPGEALFKANKDAYQRGFILGGQVHTHPQSAYHSMTDDHYPLVTLLGALSMVLPDFAKNAPDDREVWAWYRLADVGTWTPASKNTKVVFE
jgi:hypothetical protein